MAWASKQGWARFIGALSPAQGDRILDVGAGRGGVANRVLEAPGHPEVYAVDPNSKRVDAMKRDFPGVKGSTAAAESLPFPDGFFDKVYTTMALHHFADLDGAAKEIARVLKPGGTFTVVEVDPRSGRARLFRLFGRFNGEHMNLMSAEQVSARLGGSGLFRSPRTEALGYAYMVQLARIGPGHD